MKAFKKWYDFCIVAFCLLLFLILRITSGSSVLLYLLIPIIGILAHFGITYYFDAQEKEEKSSFEYQFNEKKQSNEKELAGYISQMRELVKKNYDFEYVVSEFEIKVADFSKKEEALIDLIHLNGDSAKQFLLERSMATNDFIIANAKKLIKSMIAYQAQTTKSRPNGIENVKAVKDALSSLQGLAENYDDLLNEVAKMGDDFNPEDPKLMYVVENLQELRKHVDDEDDEQAEGDSADGNKKVGLFVTPTPMAQGQGGRRN